MLVTYARKATKARKCLKTCSLPQFVCLIAALAHIVDAYLYPIQQEHQRIARQRRLAASSNNQATIRSSSLVAHEPRQTYQQQLGWPEITMATAATNILQAPTVISLRRQDDESGIISNGQISQSDQQPADSNSERNLRQLHKVVETVTELLNAEEKIADRAQRSLDEKINRERVEKVHNLMSESEIKQAIEELEQIQRQERAAAAATEAASAGKASNQVPEQIQVSSHSTDSSTRNSANIESLMGELNDELLNEQINVAARDAERVLQQKDMSRNTPGDKSFPTQQHQSRALSAPITQNPLVEQVNSTASQQSLFVGQLDSLAAELSSAFSDEFYPFQAGSNDASQPRDINLIGNEQPRLDSQLKQQAENSLSNMVNDLESAAQTRNLAHTSHLEPQSMAVGQFIQPSSSPRPVEFSSPVGPIDPRVQLRPPDNGNSETLIRNFRQQPNAPNLESSSQFPPTSTIIPVVNNEPFWRPSNLGHSNDPSDLQQQYNRAISSQQNLNPLPGTRFQNLSPPEQFPQVPRHSQHFHFTGGAFLPSNNGPPQFPPLSALQNSRDRTFSSTSAPLISVLSDSDTSGGKSVSWNPPASMSPPPSTSPSPTQPQLFNQQFPAPAQNLPSRVDHFNQPPSQTISRGAAPLSPRNPFPSVQPHELPFTRLHQDIRPPQNPNVVTATEFSNAPEASTEGKFLTSTTALNDFPTPSRLSNERDASDSQPRSSIRSLANNQKFFSPNEFSGSSSTLPTIENTEGSRQSRPIQPVLTTTPASTAVNSPRAGNGPSNSTNKEDTVIYYYYYYDDNKNATVVAKNITSPNASNPLSLDEAIEADAGLEDTPYMDDPVPVRDIRPSHPAQPITSTTTSTTTAGSSGSFEPTPASELRGRPHSINPKRVSVSSESLSSAKPPKASNNKEINLSSNRGNQPRATTFDRSLAGSSRQPTSNSITQSPFSVPSSSTVRVGSHQPTNFETHPLSRSTTTSSAISAGSQNTVRTDSSTTTHFNAPNKIQKDVVHNALNGISTNDLRSSQPVGSSSPGGSRNPLSNASRYGAPSSNQMLDPFGIDPSAPTSPLAHAGHSVTDHHAHHNHKNPSHTTSPNGVSHQAVRKPNSGMELTSDIPLSADNFSSTRNPVSSVSTSRTTGTQFNFGRNIESSLPSSTNSLPVTPSSTAPSVVSEPGNNTGNVSGPEDTVQPEVESEIPERTPEQPNKLTNNISRPVAVERPSPAERPVTSFPPKMLPARNQPIEKIERHRGVEVARERPSNGRPSTPDGNISNGFTRSPLQSPMPTSAPSVTRTQSLVIDRSVPSSTSPTNTQSTTNDFASKPSANLQQMQVIPMVTPVVVSTSMSTSVTQSFPTPNNVVTQTNPTNSTPTSSNSESSSTASTSEQTGASTRRKFGNRFQTRLNSLSAASSARQSSTSTTPAPSSSTTTTTRRPMISTTRKSSRQLFAGRRRSSAPPAENNITSITTSVTSTVSSSVETSTPTSSSSTSRSRFSNSFTSRSRSTTASPAVGSANPEVVKPGLFVTPRNPTRSRLSILKNNRISGGNSEVNTDNSTSSIEANPVGGASNEQRDSAMPTVIQDKPSPTEKPIISSSEPALVEDTPADEPATGTLTVNEASVADRKEQPVAAATSAEQQNAVENTTLAPSPESTPAPDSTNSRNKPRVRPLFASRQRNSSLFGNRRNSTAAST